MNYADDPVRQRIYNSIVDDMTRTMQHDGYRVLVSEAYPAAGEPKYIVWGDRERKKAFMFIWHIEDDTYELCSALYDGDAGPGKFAWEKPYNICVTHMDLTPQDEEDLKEQFLENLYLKMRARQRGKRLIETDAGRVFSFLTKGQERAGFLVVLALVARGAVALIGEGKSKYEISQSEQTRDLIQKNEDYSKEKGVKWDGERFHFTKDDTGSQRISIDADGNIHLLKKQGSGGKKQ